MIPTDGMRKYAPSIPESIPSSTALKLPIIQQKKRIMHPLLSSSGIVPLPTILHRSTYKSNVTTAKVLSYKEQKLKNLETQLAEINLLINELTKENNLLKSIQKKHELSLKRYENANGEIPKLINSHNEEIRSWQVRHNQLKLRYRDVVERTKAKEEELLTLTRDHDNLLKRTKELKIEERVVLEKELQELRDKKQAQEDTISTLQRRIILEEKNHKHQMKQTRNKSKENRTRYQSGDASNHHSPSTEES